MGCLEVGVQNIEPLLPGHTIYCNTMFMGYVKLASPLE